VARISSTEIPWLRFSPRFSKEHIEGEEKSGFDYISAPPLKYISIGDQDSTRRFTRKASAGN
jgi:hypothetical protein